jgi:hypothetical protein
VGVQVTEFFFFARHDAPIIERLASGRKGAERKFMPAARHPRNPVAGGHVRGEGGPKPPVSQIVSNVIFPVFVAETRVIHIPCNIFHVFSYSRGANVKSTNRQTDTN